MDTGATESVVPASALARIGVSPRTRREYELTDGRRQTFSIATAELEVMGEIVGGTVVFGPDDAEPLLGCTALESAGLEVDPPQPDAEAAPGNPAESAPANPGRVIGSSPVPFPTNPRVRPNPKPPAGG